MPKIASFTEVHVTMEPVIGSLTILRRWLQRLRMQKLNF